MTRMPVTRPTGYVPATARAIVPSTVPHGQNVLDAQAAAVKATYVAERSAWETFKSARPVDYRAPRTYDGISAATIAGELEVRPGRESEWLKLVRWCRTRNLHPAAYVQLVFSVLDRAKQRAPEPPQLRSDVCYALWVEHAPKIVQRLAGALQSERATASRRVAYEEAGGENRENALVLVLVSDATPLSPLFRYCMARQIKGRQFERLAAFWEARAVTQFQRHRAQYLEAWGAVLPEGFPALADRMGPAGSE